MADVQPQPPTVPQLAIPQAPLGEYYFCSFLIIRFILLNFFILTTQ